MTLWWCARAVCAVLVPVVRWLGRRGWRRTGRALAAVLRPLWRYLDAHRRRLSEGERRGLDGTRQVVLSEREQRHEAMRAFWTHGPGTRAAGAPSLEGRRERNRRRRRVRVPLSRGQIAARATRVEVD